MRSTEILAGLLLIVLPIAFNVAFALLASRFGYPDILRRPTAEVLRRFREGGTGLVTLWWSFAMTAVLFAVVVVLLSNALTGANSTLLAVTTTAGVLAAVVQFLGLIRWPFVVPYLAREYADPAATPARLEAIEVVFQAFNHYLGVAVGEHLGYFFTGAWSLFAGVAITQAGVVPGWIGIGGIVAGPVLVLCSLEFVGPFEQSGWSFAGMLTPIAYVAWSIWLLGTGLALLV